MTLSKKVVVRDSVIAGKGLVCVERIEPGEMVWQAEAGDAEKYFFTREQIAQWSEADQATFMNFAYMVKPGLWSGVPPGVDSDKSEYMNHSCNANVRWVNDDLMVADRVITPGEEVTFDYGTSESFDSDHMPFKCGCGAAQCRGAVTGYDMFRPAIRARWGEAFTELAKSLQKEYDEGKITIPDSGPRVQPA